jgi:hypothetical protein
MRRISRKPYFYAGLTLLAQAVVPLFFSSDDSWQSLDFWAWLGNLGVYLLILAFILYGLSSPRS